MKDLLLSIHPGIIDIAIFACLFLLWLTNLRLSSSLGEVRDQRNSLYWAHEETRKIVQRHDNRLIELATLLDVLQTAAIAAQSQKETDQRHGEIINEVLAKIENAYQYESHPENSIKLELNRYAHYCRENPNFDIGEFITWPPKPLY